jgi:hypothetical protein
MKIAARLLKSPPLALKKRGTGKEEDPSVVKLQMMQPANAFGFGLSTEIQG